MKILLIQLRQLGDILLTTPCIREIRQALPDAQIDFCCHRMGRLILNENPYLNDILEYSEGQSFTQQMKFLHSIYRQRYDVVFDFMNNPRSAIITIASQAKRRIGFDSARRYAYNVVIAKPADNQYIVKKKFHLLKPILSPLGFEAQNTKLDFPFQRTANVDEFFVLLQEEFRRSSVAQKTQQISPRYIALSPTHRREQRQWPIERWAALARILESDPVNRVVWIWGPGELDFVKACQRLAEHRGILAPETKLSELGALLDHCQLFIGNSNGPSHIAVAVDTPSLQLHGPTNALAWCPATERHTYIQSETKKMADISLNQVLEKVHSLQW